ncbi:hypothetical protein U9M48_002312 [Paspalum notatum var. saurae]|uniref:Uncharacterized protein n=1 Tax=Paspalum notatum var. saurae TaxID=547442 RepID=A0AAQ3PQN1_PASNO
MLLAFFCCACYGSGGLRCPLLLRYFLLLLEPWMGFLTSPMVCCLIADESSFTFLDTIFEIMLASMLKTVCIETVDEAEKLLGYSPADREGGTGRRRCRPLPPSSRRGPSLPAPPLAPHRLVATAAPMSVPVAAWRGSIETPVRRRGKLQRPLMKHTCLHPLLNIERLQLPLKNISGTPSCSAVYYAYSNTSAAAITPGSKRSTAQKSPATARIESGSSQPGKSTHPFNCLFDYQVCHNV